MSTGNYQVVEVLVDPVPAEILTRAEMLSEQSAKLITTCRAALDSCLAARGSDRTLARLQSQIRGLEYLVHNEQQNLSSIDRTTRVRESVQRGRSKLDGVVLNLEGAVEQLGKLGTDLGNWKPSIPVASSTVGSITLANKPAQGVLTSSSKNGAAPVVVTDDLDHEKSQPIVAFGSATGGLQVPVHFGMPQDTSDLPAEKEDWFDQVVTYLSAVWTTSMQADATRLLTEATEAGDDQSMHYLEQAKALASAAERETSEIKALRDTALLLEIDLNSLSTTTSNGPLQREFSKLADLVTAGLEGASPLTQALLDSVKEKASTLFVATANLQLEVPVHGTVRGERIGTIVKSVTVSEDGAIEIEHDAVAFREPSPDDLAAFERACAVEFTRDKELIGRTGYSVYTKAPRLPHRVLVDTESPNSTRHHASEEGTKKKGSTHGMD